MTEPELVCNDIHSRLNSTTVRGRLAPATVEEAASLVQQVRSRGEFMSVCGSCHAMGGQQFATGGWLLDMRGMNRVIDFDRATRSDPCAGRHHLAGSHSTLRRRAARQRLRMGHQTEADRR